LQFGVIPIYFGFVGLNLPLIFLGFLVLLFAFVQKIRGKTTHNFEVSFLLLLVGVLLLTFHGRLLQSFLPFSLPEKPLLDNNLTFNYALSNLLAFGVFPILALIIMKSDFSLERLGLRVINAHNTMIYSFAGIISNVLIFILTRMLFGDSWVQGYTFDGLILWILLVTIGSVFIQTFFFVGILFNKYMTTENVFLLATISILAFQATVSASLPWLISDIIASSAKVFVTWKTRNIYGAASMSIVVSFIEIAIQIL
jgi:hypothetical protein